MRCQVPTRDRTIETPHRWDAARVSDIRQLLGQDAIVGSYGLWVVSIALDEVPAGADAVADRSDVSASCSHELPELVVGITRFRRTLPPFINSPKEVVAHVSIEKLGDGRALRQQADLPELHPGNVADRRAPVDAERVHVLDRQRSRRGWGFG
jgi:hypothetical protein